LTTASAIGSSGYNAIAGEHTGAANAAGNIPFTGTDLLLYVAVGGIIAVSGSALRALSRS